MNIITTFGGLAKQARVKKRKRKFATFDFMSSVWNVVLYNAKRTLDKGAILDHPLVSLFCNIIVGFEHLIFSTVKFFICLSGEAFERVQKSKLNERKLSYVVLHEMGKSQGVYAYLW
tara:strand:+ start:880 stop:1230 length:351 start_codon:yes stop_codon:yes gene_type:complete